VVVMLALAVAPHREARADLGGCFTALAAKFPNVYGLLSLILIKP
jgi:hypothetical protein